MAEKLITSDQFYACNTRQALLELMPKKEYVIAEIGVQEGNNAADIMRICQPYKLFLVDPWRHQDIGYGNDPANVSDDEQERLYASTIDRFKQNPRIEIIREFSYEAAIYFNAMSVKFDWIYIDANHSYEAVLMDLAQFAPMVCDTGYIVLHDYTNQHGWGVLAAISHFCQSTNWKVIGITNEPNYPHAILQRKETA